MHPLTKREALHIIKRVFAQQEGISTAQMKAIEVSMFPNENILQTLCRIGDCPEILNVKPFDHQSVYFIVSRRLDFLRLNKYEMSLECRF